MMADRIGGLSAFTFENFDTGERKTIYAACLENAQAHYPHHRRWVPIDPNAPRPKTKLVIGGGQIRKVLA